MISRFANCSHCGSKQAEINGLREVIRNQQEFILRIKKMIADYSGESTHWERLRAKSGRR